MRLCELRQPATLTHCALSVSALRKNSQCFAENRLPYFALNTAIMESDFSGEPDPHEVVIIIEVGIGGTLFGASVSTLRTAKTKWHFGDLRR
jgi:hypothetical protein